MLSFRTRRTSHRYNLALAGTFLPQSPITDGRRASFSSTFKRDVERRSMTQNTTRNAGMRRPNHEPPRPIESDIPQKRIQRESAHSVEFGFLEYESAKPSSVYEPTPTSHLHGRMSPAPARRQTLPPPAPASTPRRAAGSDPIASLPQAPIQRVAPPQYPAPPNRNRSTARVRPSTPRTRAESYEKIASRESENRDVLVRLLDIYRDERRWPEALATVDRLAALETIKSHRSRYHYASGVLLRDELARPDLALSRFEAALDDDPSHLKAFGAIDEYCTQHREWPRLERAYRKMIARATTGSQPGLLKMLWCNLGEVYRSRMGNLKSASVAYEMATKIDPNDAKLHTILAELYERLALEEPELYVDRIASAYQSMLICDPGDPESYRNLFGHFQALGDYDRAFGYCAGLAAMRRATPSEQQYFDARRPRGYLTPTRTIDSALIRRYLHHPNRDPQLTSLFTLLAPSLIAVLAMPTTRIAALAGARRVEPSLERGHILRAVQHVQRVLGCVAPTVYIQPNLRGAPRLYFVKTPNGPNPVLVVPGDLAREDDATKLSFAIARTLALLDVTSAATVAVNDDPSLLKAGFLAACYLCDFAHDETDQRVIALADHLRRRLDPVRTSQMRQLVNRLLESTSSARELDARQWIAATHLTAMRVGLLVAGDLCKAVIATAAESAAQPERLDGRTAIKELVLFGINENYFDVRQRLGLDVKR
jgi:hypothetical protein